MGLYANGGEPPTLNQSLDLAESAGWQLYPAWGVDERGVCKCRKRAKCPYPGKHPTTRNGIKDASSDPQKIAAMFARAPEGSNVALATGKVSGVVALDNDEVGCGGSIRWLRQHYGSVPETRTHWSGSGNVHELFAYPEDLPSRRISWAHELKADGTGVLLPPSLTDKGFYEVLDDRPLAPLPSWVVDFAKGLTVIEGEGPSERTESRFVLPAVIREGERWDTLWRYGCSLRAHGWGYDQILQELLRVSREVCEQPPTHPLADSEVRKAAGYAMKYEPGHASMVSEQVLAAVTFLEEKTGNRDKSGLAAYSRWAVYRALLDTAKAHGYMHGNSIGVNISVRQLAAASGVSKPTVLSVIKALGKHPLVYRISSGQGARAGDFALTLPQEWAHTFTNRTTPRVSIERGVAPKEEPVKRIPLYALRHGYIGKVKGAVLEQVIVAGEIKRNELAKKLKKKPESLRRHLKELVALGLLERMKQGTYRAVGNWERRLERERVMSGEAKSARLDEAAHERDRERYSEYLTRRANKRREQK